MADSTHAKGRHDYAARVIWDGDRREGTATYANYSRRYRVVIAGKPDLVGTADTAFRGEADKHNPEDLFLTAISACHMLSYLALCALKRVRVVAYEDNAEGVMTVQPSGAGKFDQVTLHPRVTIAEATDMDLAKSLHKNAHEMCFIANSCSVPIRHEATVQVG
jgi:organic hydroperoxide reductase OsmC/OhrA